MGSKVWELEKEIEGRDPLSFLIALVIFFGIVFLVGDAFDDAGTAFGFIVGFESIFGIPIASIFLIAELHTLKADPQKFIEAYRKDEPQTPEIEILEKAYSEPHKYISEAFRDTLLLWLGLGAITALVDIAVITGSLEIKDLTKFWVLIGLSSLLSAASFILMIIFYLRKRSIEKALFAIQLKKSDKAEISIKI
ncbi:hypothetical protein A3L11_00115 [Thermococcus siculi]|uniref:Uncharacterized protein n=1 Tax=Thermococcus siculi TaxID=72803 RepID=A0A2Z2MH84_9EURY|nr:hypothetical protein [Thermococcus siculi]ASJ07719.1 hypothetical protein A3L11_00115 [Thermococcus siculi]